MFYAPTTEVETDFRTPIVKKPLVIFLHGSSLCGNNLERVKRYGTINAIEKGRELDAYVLAPQNPGGSWKPEKIMKIVDHLLAEHNDIDANRIYVLGMSLGGYGTIDLAATYPDRIAAAMALCGGGTVRNYAGLNKVPLWIIHGTADAAVSIRESDKVVNNMKQSSPDTPRLVYTRVPGMNHSQPCRMFYLKESYDWLFSHSLSDKDRSIAPTFDAKAGMASAYKDLRHTRRAKAYASKSTTKKPR